MKLYHGTSFENACKILSDEFWYPILFATPLEYKQLGKWELANKPISLFIGMAKTHFTTNVNDAKGYALLHKHPVILWWDNSEITKGGRYVFGANDPIPTNQVKALIGCTHEIMFFGTLVNTIYSKVQKSLIIRSPLRGILCAPSRKSMISFLEIMIKDIKEDKP
jgi:hypothetical protein